MFMCSCILKRKAACSLFWLICFVVNQADLLACQIVSLACSNDLWRFSLGSTRDMWLWCWMYKCVTKNTNQHFAFLFWNELDLMQLATFVFLSQCQYVLKMKFWNVRFGLIKASVDASNQVSWSCVSPRNSIGHKDLLMLGWRREAHRGIWEGNTPTSGHKTPAGWSWPFSQNMCCKKKTIFGPAQKSNGLIAQVCSIDLLRYLPSALPHTTL